MSFPRLRDDRDDGDQIDTTAPEREDGERDGEQGDGPLPLVRAAAGRYRLGAEVARGSMGRIVEAYDHELRRRVALKICTTRAPGARRRFVREAQIAAQLDHPNVVPVHEIGCLDGGELYYAMKLVHGRTFGEVMQSFGRLRLLHVLEQVAMGVGYAHSKGILHRDLKPANVMVGRHGEVYVMDWGLAKLAGDPAESLPLDPIDLEVAPNLTIDGSIFGTPEYMSPEQAGGRPLDARSDVYALGVMLYEILVGEKRYVDLPTWEVLRRTVQRDLDPPRKRAPHAGIAEEIECVCLRAVARKPGDRYATATDLGEAIRSFLEGAERAQRADERVAEARHAAGEYERLRDEAARTREDVRRVTAGVPPSAGLEDKRRLWRAEREADAAELRRDAALARVEDLCEQALGFVAEHAGARACLAALYRRLHEQAETARDRRLAAHYERLLARHDDGAHAAYLEGMARLAVESDPPGAEVVVYRYVDEDGLLVAAEPRALGATPLHAPLAFGSHLLVLRREGFRDTRCPVLLGRSESLVVRVRLRSDGEIGEGFVYVPAGRFVFGGDPEAPASRERAVLELPDFAIARFPVTCGEYVEFLDALPPEKAARRAPKFDGEKGLPVWSPAPDGRYRLPLRDADGDVWEPAFPVAGVTVDDAEAYARWRAARDGASYRLPSEEEWEMAARGADGRRFPWGHRFDPCLCLMLQSRPGRPFFGPVGLYPTDESPYGVRDMAGGIRDWTQSPAVEDPSLRVARGGGFSRAEAGCRLAFREPDRPGQAAHYRGFRLVKLLPA